MNSNIENTVQKPPRATAALILSIVSILLLISFPIIYDSLQRNHPDALATRGWFAIYMLLLAAASGIVGLIFSIKSKKLIAKNPEKYSKKGVTTALVLSIVGTALAVVIIIIICLSPILFNS